MMLPPRRRTLPVFPLLIAGLLLIGAGVTHAAPRDGGSGAADAGVKRLLQQCIVAPLHFNRKLLYVF